MPLESKFENVRVLVAEDFEFNREILLEMLRLMNIEADEAYDGEMVIEMVKQKNYDLILMDLQMPKKDGRQVASEIRKLGQNEVKIIALTASAVQSDKEKCLESGMDDYTTKPLELKVLEQLLRKHLSSYLVTA